MFAKINEINHVRLYFSYSIRFNNINKGKLLFVNAESASQNINTESYYYYKMSIKWFKLV